MNDTKTTRSTRTSQTTPAADALEERVVALAEQLGRLVGTVQARTDGWLDRQSLNEQLTRIRDGATGLLGHLDAARVAARRRLPAKRNARAKPVTKAAASKPRGRSGGKVDAPGKAHRKAPAQAPGIKHSDEMIPKMRAAQQMRERGPRG